VSDELEIVKCLTCKKDIAPEDFLGVREFAEVRERQSGELLMKPVIAMSFYHKQCYGPEIKS